MENKSKVRKAILEAAETLFSQYGYEKTSIDQITHLANRAKTSLYYHFDSKLSIFRSCLEGEFLTMRERLAAVRSANRGGDAECLVQYLRERMELLPQMPVYRTYINGMTFNIGGGELKQTADAVREDFDRAEYRYFYETARKGRENGVFSDKVSPDAFARMLIVILRGLEIQFFVGKDVKSIRSTYEALIEMMVLSRSRTALSTPSPEQ